MAWILEKHLMFEKKVLILTSRFPYEGGEYFLETEQRYWHKVDGVNFYLMPYFVTKRLREFPGWISLRSENSMREKKLSRVKYVLAAFFSPLLRAEVRLLLRNGSLNYSRLFRAVLVLSRVLQIKASMRSLASELGGIDLVYSYWNNSSAYAAVLLKKEGLIKTIVTRAHGSDLYRHALEGQYMPFKYLLAGEFDFVAAVSQGGRDYFIKEYRVNNEKVGVAPLGVELSGHRSSPSDSGEFSIVSVSNCVPIKRLDVIVDAVILFARLNPDVKVVWRHIGDGALLNQIKERWREQSISLENVQALFLGRLINREVLQTLSENPCDVIVNSSASEGVPVSLMEAMSLGIPAVAPDIGGISELVTVENGYLLPPMPTANDLVAGLNWGFKVGKTSPVRNAAEKKVSQYFSAERNYGNFFNFLIKKI